MFGAFIPLKNCPLMPLPDITNNQVTVITVYQQLQLKKLKSFITNPLEISMSNLPDVKEIRSISRFGLSLLQLCLMMLETHTALGW